MKIKRFTALITAAVLVLALTGCAGKGNGTLSEKEDKAKLISILDDIADSKRSGSESGTLNSVRIAADLVSWAASSNMSKTEAAKVAADWLKDQPEADREVIKEKLKGVAEAYGKIAVDGARELLEDTGLQKKINDFSGNLKDTVEAVLNEVQKNNG